MKEPVLMGFFPADMSDMKEDLMSETDAMKVDTNSVLQEEIRDYLVTKNVLKKSKTTIYFGRGVFTKGIELSRMYFSSIFPGIL